jgi:hypothetical protein
MDTHGVVVHEVRALCGANLHAYVPVLEIITDPSVSP